MIKINLQTAVESIMCYRHILRQIKTRYYIIPVKLCYSYYSCYLYFIPLLTRAKRDITIDIVFIKTNYSY